ncbi:hypothetical protein Ancab_002609 [Ancistrocladus abbreviatus]
METVTLGELHVYHAADREVFSRLVKKIKVDIARSLLILALWLYLEDTGEKSVISKMARTSHDFLKALVNEANLCLDWLQAHLPASSGRLALLGSLMEKEISLRTLSQNKYTTIYGIKLFLNNVCSWIFSDIVLQILPTTSRLNPTTPLIIPGFPNPTFGSMKIFPRPLNSILPYKGIWGWKLTDEVPESERTMFLTFSLGYAVSDTEVKELFEGICGAQTVEAICMEDAVGDKQPMYARMVVSSISNVDQILLGRSKAKFQINKKHVWARKYERRERHN